MTYARAVHVAAMGQLQLVGSEELRQQQPLAVLTYLAIDGAKTRDHLATVFWPKAKKPLNNLSSALTRIRDRLPAAISIEGGKVACVVPTDVADLQNAIEAHDAASIVQLYQGHFFESADMRSMGIELEEWVFSTREALACAASNALLAVAEDQLTRSPAQAVTVARQAYEIGRTFWFTAEPWQRCHDLLVGRAGVVAERVRIEAGEHGFELDTIDVPFVPAGLPVDGLFGRAQELATLTSFVHESPSQWLALVGMGGVGKTAVARTLLRQLRQSETPISAQWISLVDLHDVDRMPDAIAAALGIPYGGRSDLVAGLRLGCSSDKPMVVILDNIEQLPGCESVLEDVAAVEGLTLIVTSRVATGHCQERALRLNGLARCANNDAGIALFNAKALPFCPAIVEQPDLVRQICGQVNGLPLAIELCAGWLRSIPLSVLASSLETSYELVETSPGGSLESIDSILDSSWELLDDEDACVLSQLALFDGHFGYGDATSVSNATLTCLARLTDRSLIERRDDELVLHPLVRSHARRQLDAAPGAISDAAESRFVDHFRAEMVESALLLRGPEAGKIAPRLAAGFANVQVAWDLALEQRDWDAVADMVDGVDQHLKSQSRQFLAARLFEHALDTIGPFAEASDAHVGARTAFVAIGWRYALARTVQGHSDDAADALTRCVLHCAPTDAFGQMGLAYTQGHIAIFAGEYERAAELFDHARSIDDGSIDEWFIAEVDAGRALVALSVGDNDEGRRLLRSVLDTGRRLENPVTITSAYYFLGTLEFAEDPAKALVLLEEGCAVAAKASMTHMSRKYATMVGRCHVKLGDAMRAVAVFEEALGETADEAQLVREPWVRVANQAGMAMAHASIGNRDDAAPWFVQALRSQVELEDWPLLLETVLEICRLRADSATSGEWLELLAVVAEHPATMWEWKRDVGELLTAAYGHPNQALQRACRERSCREEERIDVVAERAVALLHA